METVSERLNETRRHVLAFVDEEARGWRRFVVRLGAELSVTALERRLLTSVDGALRAMDERVKTRLARLTKKPRPARARKKKALHATPLAA